MANFESVIRWHQWSVGIILTLLLGLAALTKTNLIHFTFLNQLACAVLLLSLVLNLNLLKTRSRLKLPWDNEVADGLLIVGLLLVFIGTFF